MAKGRKRTTNLTFMEKDKRLFQGISKCGKAITPLIEKYYNISQKRIDRFVKQGYLIKSSAIWENKSIMCYGLSEKGKKWVKNNIHTVNSLYKPARGATHDIALFQEYSKLSRKEQDLSLTETDISRQNKLSYASPVDLYIPPYQDESGIIIQGQAIEIITPAYSKDDIEKKAIYVEECLKTSNFKQIFVNYKHTREL
ncbi:hypothetical protein HZF24_05020 [Sedimentibacter hydroxybenzoicus DSM 7310]|uniref:Uncharacterized protein n=1 Tax=Sedimentibacter hydroxybenzoicus DSM 7310 TaxID=1123245 RepID=A0A974BIK0_SEDHY|nr:hypothetical protein [Sedimentibacter hydroxybenzoicus]NYB73496.1 hypothetical protein [Sedimentibacter hydroxybenzoicus DSM 7310]